MCFIVLFFRREECPLIQLHPEPEPSGVHSRKWESFSGKIPVLPFFTLRRTIPICHQRSCHFRRVCEFSEKERERVHLSSFHVAAPHFSYLGHTYRLTRFLKIMLASPYEDTGLFLFKRAEIELPLPGFEFTTLNSVTFGPIFRLNLATTSSSLKASKLKICP